MLSLILLSMGLIAERACSKRGSWILWTIKSIWGKVGGKGGDAGLATWAACAAFNASTAVSN
jgi:hypothetical protein